MSDVPILDRRLTIQSFRDRLREAMEAHSLTQSGLARRIGVDRSTLSQLLSVDNDRLPRADTVASIAVTLQVSVDWLLGLRQDARVSADILAQSVVVAGGDRETAEARLAAWHDEAAGYKIRYVPSSIPDILKSERVNEYEYTPFAVAEPAVALARTADHLAYSRRPETDIEVCNTVQAVEGFALGQGLWAGLALEDRREQLRRMIHLVDELYPTFRWFLYDGQQRYSVPLTVFGPHRAAVYVGQMYFVFTTTEHIRVLTRHFDDLIRAARIQPTDVGDFLRAQLARAERDG